MMLWLQHRRTRGQTRALGRSVAVGTVGVQGKATGSQAGLRIVRWKTADVLAECLVRCATQFDMRALWHDTAGAIVRTR